MRRHFSSHRLVAAVIVLLLSLASQAFILAGTASTTASAASDCQAFPETGYSVCGKFLQYWQSHGGLAQQGYPISYVFEEKNADPPAGDGKIHKVQYFQRARFEDHPENAQPYDVLLGLLGTEQVKAKYSSGLPPTTLHPTANCQKFDQTGFTVCGRFLEYWNASGGLAQQGYPISEAFMEQNAQPPAGDGKTHTVQYFQRGRFELHEENTQPYDVLLGLLGAEQLSAKYPGGTPPEVTPPPANPAPSPAPAPGPQPGPTPQPAPNPPSNPGTAGVKFISVVGGRPGQYASVTVQTSPGARCSIDYVTPKGNDSTAQGLVDKTADGNGRVSWSWKIGTRTESGTGTVTVTCNGTSESAPIYIG